MNFLTILSKQNQYCRNHAGVDPGEMKWVNFHSPFSEPPSFFFFSFPSNIEIIFDFSDIITKIHRPFQNPGPALVMRTTYQAFQEMTVQGKSTMHQKLICAEMLPLQYSLLLPSSTNLT